MAEKAGHPNRPTMVSRAYFDAEWGWKEGDHVAEIGPRRGWMTVGELGLLDPMPYRLTVNGRIVQRGTLAEIQAAVAELVTTRLAAAPERLADEAQAVRKAFAGGDVEREVETLGSWFFLLDPHGDAPQRIKVLREG